MPEDELPIDSDIDDRADRAHVGRAPHLRPGLIVLVGIGGAVGTATRAAATAVAGHRLGVGTAGATLIINVVGCLLLGVLLERLIRLGADRGRRRGLRLLLGTGFLGGFTTYSTLALEVAEGLRGGRWAWSSGYAFGSLLLGLIACLAGIAVGGLGAPGRRRSGSAGATR